MDRGSWRAIVHVVQKSQARVINLTTALTHTRVFISSQQEIWR